MGGVECYVRSMPNIYRYKNEWMEQHAEKVETLILGNSFCLNGVIPEDLGHNSYNLSGVGQTLKYDHFLFFKWATHYKKLKVVIMPVSYFSLYVGNTILPDEIMEMNYKIYMDCPYHSDFSCYNFESFHFKHIHGKLFNAFSCNKASSVEALGWIGSSSMPMVDYKKWSNTNKRYAKLLTIKSNANVNNNIRIICDVANYCIEHGVRLVLISTPHWKEYNQLLDKTQLRQTNYLIRQIQNQFPVEYYNYREDASFELSDFSDMRHLSQNGAKKFTKMLKNDLQ